MYRDKPKSLMDPVHPVLLSVQERKYGLKDVYMFNVPKAEEEMERRWILLSGLDFGRMQT